jgi:predicted sulfurtransferase
MFQLFYASSISPDFDIDRDIEKILHKAQAYNSTKGITGILLFKSGIFLQLLEGEENEVKALYAKIYNDKRHKNLTLIFETHGNERIFEHWTMAYRKITDIDFKMVNQMLSWNKLLTKSQEIDNELILKMLQSFKEKITMEELPTRLNKAI